MCTCVLMGRASAGFPWPPPPMLPGGPREHVSTFNFQLGPREWTLLARSRSNFLGSREKQVLRGALKLWKQAGNSEGAEASRRNGAGRVGRGVGWSGGQL